MILTTSSQRETNTGALEACILHTCWVPQTISTLSKTPMSRNLGYWTNDKDFCLSLKSFVCWLCKIHQEKLQWFVINWWRDTISHSYSWFNTQFKRRGHPLRQTFGTPPAQVNCVTGLMSSLQQFPPPPGCCQESRWDIWSEACCLTWKSCSELEHGDAH